MSASRKAFIDALDQLKAAHSNLTHAWRDLDETAEDATIDDGHHYPYGEHDFEEVTVMVHRWANYLKEKIENLPQ